MFQSFCLGPIVAAAFAELPALYQRSRQSALVGPQQAAEVRIVSR